MMDVFLMIRRKKTTIFCDTKDSATIGEVKRIIEGITKIPPEEQKLFRDKEPLDDNKTLNDSGFTSSTAKPQAPATIGLVYKQEDGEFEPLEITPFSTPPELPDVMKPQESTSGHAVEQTA